MPQVFIIVLNWNGKHHLSECFDSLSSLDCPNYKIILVDNGSQDGSVPFVALNYPHIHIVQNDRNLGFAEGNNVGIRYALSQGADYVVLLNNDTRVEPDFLTHLIRRGEENKETGVLGGKVLMFSNPLIVNSTGVNLNQFGYGWDRDFGEEVQDVKREAGKVLAVTGSLMAIRKEVFEKVGLLDPKYFAFFEDVDFCIRVWKYTNFTVEYVPDSVIYHKFSATAGDSSFKRKLMLRNQYRIFFKHFPLFKIITVFPLFCLHRLGAVANYLIKRDFHFFYIESLIIFKSWLLLPLILFRRIPDCLNKETDEKRFWDKVIPERKLPSFKAYSGGYERIFLKKAELQKGQLTNRIVMGMNDEILGLGWSKLINGHPSLRRMKERGICFLNNEKKFEYFQIHGLWDLTADERLLEIRIENKIIGRKRVEFGWKTYIFSFENSFPEGPTEVELRILPFDLGPEKIKGFGVNEAALLSLGSPFLRLIET